MTISELIEIQKLADKPIVVMSSGETIGFISYKLSRTYKYYNQTEPPLFINTDEFLVYITEIITYTDDRFHIKYDRPEGVLYSVAETVIDILSFLNQHNLEIIEDQWYVVGNTHRSLFENITYINSKILNLLDEDSENQVYGLYRMLFYIIRMADDHNWDLYKACKIVLEYKKRKNKSQS